MAYRVTFSPPSRKDIADIVSHIAKDSPKAALEFHDALLRRCESLSAAPELGPQVRPGVRRLVFGAYLIFYRPKPDRIQIARIIHGARLIPPSLGG